MKNAKCKMQNVGVGGRREIVLLVGELVSGKGFPETTACSEGVL
jgi:hypothetical protein